MNVGFMNQRRIVNLQRQTQNLIDSFPRTITLHRPPPLTDDGAGGRARSDAGARTLAPAVRYFEGRTDQRNSQDIVQLVDEGPLALLNRVLIGPAGDDIRVGDWFVDSGRRWVVKGVDKDTSYQVKAECEDHGRAG